MKAPLAVRGGAVSAPSLPLPAPAVPALRRLPLARLLPWALLGAIAGLALFLRLYRLDGLITYYPDTYAQLRAVENLLSGTVPVSYHYPPGVALFLAPAFALLPDTLVTMQAAILASGMALILAGYGAMLATTQDRRAALLFAAALAFGGTFVFHSRVGFFDVINTLLIACSLFLAPFAAKRGTAVLLAYGLLVFTTITVRYTDPIVLPALFLASAPLDNQRPSLRLFIDHARSRAVLTVGFVVAVLYAAYLATAFGNLTRFADSDAGSAFDLGHYLARLGDYWRASAVGYAGSWGWTDVIAAGAAFALAAEGARRLWAIDRRLLASFACLLALWAPVHAGYEVFDPRYAMPPHLFVLFLAALGLSSTVGRFRQLAQPWQRVGLVSALAFALALFVGRQLAHDITVLQAWPRDAAHNREQAYDVIRAELRDLDGPSSTLISSQVLAVDRANRELATLDLIRHSETYGINEDSIARLLAYVREQQQRGRTVYYHYTEYEDVRSRFRKYEMGFDAYFRAIQHAFTVRELIRADDRPQRLYVIEPPTSAQ